MSHVQVITLEKLGAEPYSVVGTGGFVRQLLSLLRTRGLCLPVQILATSVDAPVEMDDIPVIPLASAMPEHLQRVVLGSDIYQAALRAKTEARSLALGLEHQISYFDVTDEIQCSLMGIAPYPLPADVPAGPYALLVTLAHSAPLRFWLRNFHLWLQRQGITLVVCHPLSSPDEGVVSGATFILAWNGATEHFTAIKQQLARLGIPLTYAECGFFPQKDHFYFDRCGVNAASQLMTDPLDWVSPDQLAAVDVARETFFAGTETGDDGYCFVPLQIESDSNIQLHSRFHHGMQAYMDELANEPHDHPLLFKAHPKDLAKAGYRPKAGHMTDADTLQLIARSHCVRGINSSVLFEAALLGKPVRIDGESLLNHPCGDHKRVLAAMMARQFHIGDCDFEPDKLHKFSHIRLSHITPETA